MIQLLIYLLLLLAFFGIVWWAINKMGLPQPVQIVAVVVMAIVALLLVVQMVPGMGHLGRL